MRDKSRANILAALVRVGIPAPLLEQVDDLSKEVGGLKQSNKLKDDEIARLSGDVLWLRQRVVKLRKRVVLDGCSK